MQGMEQKLSKLTEGLKEVFTLVEQQLATSNAATAAQNTEDDAASSSSDSFDSIIHTIISKIFKLEQTN